MENNELQHWGVKGMKWGVRRYQNKDGTLTPAGRKRYARELSKLREEKKVLENKRKTRAKFDKLDAMRKENEALKSGKTGKNSSDADSPKKSIKDMSDKELASATARLQAEKNYKEAYAAMHPETVSRGKKFIDSMLDKSIEKGTTLATDLAKDYVDKVARDALGLSKKKESDPSDELKKLVNDLRNKRDAEELKDDEYQKLKRDASKAEFEEKIRRNQAAKNDKTETKTENKSESKPKDDDKVHEGEVVGESTSKGSSKKSNDGPVVDAKFSEMKVSDVPSTYVNAGKNYTEDFLRRFKYTK